MTGFRSRADLVDLHALTDRWRIRRDSEGLLVIPGRRGWVAAHAIETLCVHVMGRATVRKVLRALPGGWRRHQIGDDEANLLAPVGSLDHACEVVKAFRQRRLTADQRKRLATALLPWRFGAQKSTIEGQAMSPHSPPMGSPEKLPSAVSPGPRGHKATEGPCGRSWRAG